MRDIFGGYIPLSDDEKKNLVDEATIVVDTNVLLDLYRYRTNTSQLYLQLLEKVSDRLWLPHHVGFEFLKNRASVRAASTGSHVARLKLLAGWKDEILKAEKRSHVGQDGPEKEFLESLDRYVNHLEEELHEIEKWSSSSAPDSILERLLTLFDQRTGTTPSEAWMKEAETAGKRRAETKVPPGFKDATKPENPYGDYYIWKQILEYAKENKTDVLLVTGDVKEDWWQRVGGKTIGPLPALTDEFMRHSGQRLHMYDTARFFDVLSSAGTTTGASTIEVQSALEDIASVQDARTSTYIWLPSAMTDHFTSDWRTFNYRPDERGKSAFQAALSQYFSDRPGPKPHHETSSLDHLRESILQLRIEELRNQFDSLLDDANGSVERRQDLEKEMFKLFEELQELRERLRRSQNEDEN